MTYAGMGWPVFPLQKGSKKPRPGTRGFLDATIDVEQVLAAQWAAQPTSNIGVATGHQFEVLDLDGPDAEARFDAYQLQHDLPMPGDVDGPGALPLRVATPRGLHFYMQPTGAGNRVAFLGAGIDYRGMGRVRGRSTIGKPSGVYRFIDGPLTTPVPPCPGGGWRHWWPGRRLSHRRRLWCPVCSRRATSGTGTPWRRCEGSATGSHAPGRGPGTTP